MRVWWCVALLGCAGVEPLTLPDDRAVSGMPVGIVETTLGGQQVAIWYPATDAAGEPDAVVDLADFLDAAFTDRVPEIVPPTFPNEARVDALVRRLDAPVPLIVFSHGFGGFRTQSASLTAHLASRGYVVVSADHPGRRITDVVGCLLTPPAGTCDLGPLGGGSDPGPEDVGELLDAWPGDLPEALVAITDTDRIGMFGHSAGGATTTTFASDDDRIDAALTMAGGGGFTRDFPTLSVGGACDAVVTDADLEASANTSEGYFSIAEAGHLAFSDLCQVDLKGIADDLASREDANSLVIAGLGGLASDGCAYATPDPELETCSADAFLSIERSDAILRDMVPTFFDSVFRDGDRVDADAFDEVTRVAD